ncbi:hypothetical protein EJB05_32023 [Eragrostis curvula]|uniref:Uncharacterized protein n=1 Tax=Eragrostis curvula TaxID=38414 RepID=A0A5J9UG73_9POAL|nr:hypothetical protein EJB05_32023 [Eragrostis curvula]
MKSEYRGDDGAAPAPPPPPVLGAACSSTRARSLSTSAGTTSLPAARPARPLPTRPPDPAASRSTLASSSNPVLGPMMRCHAIGLDMVLVILALSTGVHWCLHLHRIDGDREYAEFMYLPIGLQTLITSKGVVADSGGKSTCSF